MIPVSDVKICKKSAEFAKFAAACRKNPFFTLETESIRSC